MRHIEVVGLGALNIDHIYQVERILDDGESVVNEAVSSPGGSAANTIYGLARLGMRTGFTDVVGDDAKGKMLVRDFQKLGVDTTGAGDAFATGFIYGLLNGKGLEECGRLGNIVVQFSIAKLGAREGLPTSNELAQRHQELYSERL